MKKYSKLASGLEVTFTRAVLLWTPRAPWASLSLVLLILLVHSACAPSEPPDREPLPPDGENGQTPIGSVTDDPDLAQIVIHPSPRVDWRTLLDLSLFQGFWPGMTFRMAEDQMGRPDQMGDNYNGPYWEYERPQGRVRIAHKLKGSVPFLRWWRLEGFPIASQVDRVFHPSAAGHIPTDRERLTVIVMNNEGNPGVFVEVAKDQVRSIDWVNNKGSGGTRDRS